MSKGKLEKFADMASYPHVFEYPYSVVDDVPFEMKGKWNERFFKNDHPIVLELGCGRGEYTVGLGRMFPDKNFIGVDIKGARMWSGATESLQSGMTNVAFLRTNIEIIDRFFAPGEVSEIWLTFSDPQMKKATKRLTSTYFMERYRKFLKECSSAVSSSPLMPFGSRSCTKHLVADSNHTCRKMSALTASAFNRNQACLY